MINSAALQGKSDVVGLLLSFMFSGSVDCTLIGDGSGVGGTSMTIGVTKTISSAGVSVAFGISVVEKLQEIVRIVIAVIINIIVSSILEEDNIKINQIP
jgi:hypothetical protein